MIKNLSEWFHTKRETPASRQEGPESLCLQQKDKHASGSKEELISKIKSLRKQVKKLELERDVLKGVAEIIKKDPGVSQKKLTNREKAFDRSFEKRPPP